MVVSKTLIRIHHRLDILSRSPIVIRLLWSLGLEIPIPDRIAPIQGMILIRPYCPQGMMFLRSKHRAS